MAVRGCAKVVFLSQAKRLLLVQRRGAGLALTAIARDAGELFPERVPSLWSMLLGPLETTIKTGDCWPSCQIRTLTIEHVFI